MSTIHLLKTAAGSFVPASEADAERVRRFKMGSVTRAEVAEMRNGRFFRKWWVLAQLAFDLWAETMPEQKYHGVKVLPDFERFRRDLTILAGFCRPVWNAKGELRLEAESLSWANMTEERFEQLYSATINVILHKIIPSRGLTSDSLREWVDRVMEFA